jgi:hypothetical protein
MTVRTCFSAAQLLPAAAAAAALPPAAASCLPAAGLATPQRAHVRQRRDTHAHMHPSTCPATTRAAGARETNTTGGGHRTRTADGCEERIPRHAALQHVALGWDAYVCAPWVPQLVWKVTQFRSTVPALPGCGRARYNAYPPKSKHERTGDSGWRPRRSSGRNQAACRTRRTAVAAAAATRCGQA